ncbi:MAG: hypothetical protein M1837_003341 [Sclerophora amabilis]|nr:MAG: hypothetical protein M1837_003341 [Sclerophora amabilis]
MSATSANATDNARKRAFTAITEEAHLFSVSTKKLRTTPQRSVDDSLLNRSDLGQIADSPSDSATISSLSPSSIAHLLSDDSADETSSEGSSSSASSSFSDNDSTVFAHNATGTSSSSSSSSSSPSSAASTISSSPIQELETVTIPLSSKPQISSRLTEHSLEDQSDGNGNLLSRLTTLLPALAAANSSLEEERNAGTLGRRDIEQLSGDDGCIEMNLGLGVLEERDPDHLISSSSPSSCSSSSGIEDGDESDDPRPVEQAFATARSSNDTDKDTKKRKERKETKVDILSRLMGQKHRRQHRPTDENSDGSEPLGNMSKPIIEEVS